MLPKFANMGAAETPVGTGLALRLWDEVAEVGLDV